MTAQYGPKLPISKEIHATKYRLEGEPFDDAMYRVSSTLSDGDEHRRQLSDILLNQRFMPAGRVQAAVGSPRRTTPYNCLTADTKVLTKEFGLTSLGSLQNSEATLLDGNSQWVSSKIYCHGSQKVYNVCLTNGKKVLNIGATEDHDWIVKGATGLIKTSSLKRGDRVPTKVNSTLLSIQSLESVEGFRHGYVYGDGTATQDKGYSVRVCSDLADIAPWFEGVPHSYPPSYSGDPVYYFYGSTIPTLAKEKGMKSFPSSTSVSLDYLVGFIAGWFAADGCVSNQPEVTLCASKEESEWLKVYGPLVGVYVTGMSKLGEDTNFGKRNKTVYNIRLDQRFLDESFVVIKRKRDRLKEFPVKSWRVKEVYEKGEELVYCPSVPTTNSFSGEGGILLRNCFVSGRINDDFEDIMLKATEAGKTMRLGGGIGYDFSTLRPRNSLIRSLGSSASGPVSFMDIYDAICGTISSAGHRRGAQMGVLRVDHPDIEEFIHAKRNSDSLTRFNISVGITDDFMDAVLVGKQFNLKWRGKVYKTVGAVALWDSIMRSTWDWAEPGVLFIDRINRENNLYYCEEITATNPCGEQPLPAYGACLLGSFNLVKYVQRDGDYVTFDMDKFRNDIPAVVRAMDNIVDNAIYPLPQQEEEAKNKRRMGLGVTGLANAIEVLGFPYGSDDFLRYTDYIMETLRNECYKTSVELAKEKGSFPLFDADKYCDGMFIKTLPAQIRDSIREHGIRNSHLLSIAPTGTISLSADNISSGIEPVFTHEYTRTIQTANGPIFEQVSDFAYREWGLKGKTANEVSVQEHVKVLVLCQKYVDSACSKTCNVGDEVTFDEFKNVYIDAYKGGAKGCTTFRAAGKRYGILNAGTSAEPEEQEYIDDEDEVQVCLIDPVTGQPTCS